MPYFYLHNLSLKIVYSNNPRQRLKTPPGFKFTPAAAISPAGG